MTSKRDLESTIEFLKRQQALADKHTANAWDRVHEYSRFLSNLLELDPSLDQFRCDKPSGQYVGASHRVWDIEGVKAAKEFNNAQALAARYSKREAKPAASASKGRVL